VNEQAHFPHKPCAHPDASALVGQAVFGGRLHWTRSYSCPHCDTIDVDDRAIPPREARALLLAQNGTWELIVDAPRAEAMKILAPALNLSMAEAQDYAHDLPCAYVGTKTEAEWLQGQMRAAGIRSRVERTRAAS
jgi:hypothetical protein